MVQGEGRQRTLLATVALAEPELALEAWDRLIGETPLDDLRDPWSADVLCWAAVRLAELPGVREGRRLAGVRRQVWVRNQPRRRALDAAVSTVVEAGVRPLGLRAPGLWELPGTLAGGRREAGVDLHVGPTGAERAREALERQGWVWLPGTGAGRLTTGLALASDDLRVWLYTGSGPGPGRAPVDFERMRGRSLDSDATGCPVLAREDLLAWMLTEGALLGGLGSARWLVDLAIALDDVDGATADRMAERAVASVGGPPDGPAWRLAGQSLSVVRDLSAGGDAAATVLSGAEVAPDRSVELPHLPWEYLSVGATTGSVRARLLAEAVADRGPVASARWLAGAARRRLWGRTRNRGGDPDIAAPVR